MSEFPQSDYILTEFETGWLTIWLNRPAARNALSQELTDGLWAVLRAARARPDIRGLTLRGKGGVFCAGGDIKGFKSIFQGGAQSEADVAAANAAAGELFDFLDQMPCPVIMLIEGAAMAGGMGMACAGDVVIVTKDAKFALTETTLGIPPAQIAAFVVQRLGLPQARRLMLTAARFDGEEAQRIGLADFVAENAADAEKIERSIRKNVMRCAPRANAITKQLVLATRHLERQEMIKFAGESFAKAMRGEEGREGVAAFLEKRTPAWAKEQM